MGYVLGFIFFILAFLVISIILLQEGKGGGLAGMGGAATDSVMGAKNPLRKWTVYLFVLFVIVMLGTNYYITSQNEANISGGLTVDREKFMKAVEDKQAELKAEEPAETEKSSVLEDIKEVEKEAAESKEEAEAKLAEEKALAEKALADAEAAKKAEADKAEKEAKAAEEAAKAAEKAAANKLLAEQEKAKLDAEIAAAKVKKAANDAAEKAKVEAADAKLAAEAKAAATKVEAAAKDIADKATEAKDAVVKEIDKATK